MGAAAKGMPRNSWTLLRTTPWTAPLSVLMVSPESDTDEEEVHPTQANANPASSM
jgi:hypothetical protein